MMQRSIRRILWALVRAVSVALVVTSPAIAALQGGAGAGPDALLNGDMESVGAEGKLEGWHFPLDAGYLIGPESADVFAGKGAASIDSRGVTPGAGSFGNLMQSFDAKPWQGKRVVFRAAVRVAESVAGGRAQMWLRVDLPEAGGTRRMGFFDNMNARPIVSDKWKTYEIVGDVAKDAQTIALGVLTHGQCLVHVDDAEFELAQEGAKSTGSADAGAEAPQQPFFTAWLVLPLCALALFALAFLGRGRAGKFALEFALVYWALYVLSAMVQSLVPFYGYAWASALESGPIDTIVRWAARALLGIGHELASSIGNGSGDTTQAYVQAFLTFVLALAAAVAWSLGDRRATEHARLRDLLRSGLRYYLAAQMISYGLAKLSTPNQFPEPSLWRLGRTYGESSPMGLLWTFMGSSQAYTNFAGAMEFLCGFLLVWRRTALLGALVSVGVMFNVMLMNFCYDVPVKLFSAHLVTAAAMIMLPDVRRLAQLFVGLGGFEHRAGPGSGAACTPAFPFTGRAGRIHRVVKAGLVVMVLVMPLFAFWRAERATVGVRPILGEWRLVALELDGADVPHANGEVEVMTVSPMAAPTESGWTVPCSAALVGGGSASATLTLTPERATFDTSSAGTSRLLPGDYGWSVVDGELRLEGLHVRARLVPAAWDYLLMRRGFRWINEHPFNR